ncbi:MAG: PilZ domain-containing protein [Hyphomicrobium sp.]
MFTNIAVTSNVCYAMSDLEQTEKERIAARRRVLKAGMIAYNERHVTLPCGVRDMSQSGARLTVTGSISAPDTFELLIELDGMEVPCEVVWRRGMELGVRFVSQPQIVAKKRDQVVDQWAVTTTRPSLRRKPLTGRDAT